MGTRPRRGLKGQLDEVNGVVWLGATRGGIYSVKSDDTTASFVGDEWRDVDSPPYNPCKDPFADTDGDGDVDQWTSHLSRCASPAPGAGPLPGHEWCGCLDRGDDDFDGDPDSDGDIDERDLDSIRAVQQRPGDRGGRVL